MNCLFATVITGRGSDMNCLLATVIAGRGSDLNCILNCYNRKGTDMNLNSYSRKGIDMNCLLNGYGRT